MVPMKSNSARSSTAAIMLAMAQVAVAQTAPAVARASAQKIVNERVASGRSHGLIVGVRSPDGTTYVVSAGEERPGKPIDSQTLFEIGSITKVFTGILLADMVGRGEVRL